MGVSPTLCCSAGDKPNLFYQEQPSLACLLQIAALFFLCSMSRLCPALWPTFDPPTLRNLAELEPSLTEQVEPDGRGTTRQEWHVSTPPAGFE